MQLLSEQKTAISKMQPRQVFFINKNSEAVDRVERLPNDEIHVFFDVGKQLLQVIENEVLLIRIYRWKILGSKGEFWMPRTIKQFKS